MIQFSFDGDLGKLNTKEFFAEAIRGGDYIGLPASPQETVSYKHFLKVMKSLELIVLVSDGRQGLFGFTVNTCIWTENNYLCSALAFVPKEYRGAGITQLILRKLIENKGFAEKLGVDKITAIDIGLPNRETRSVEFGEFTLTKHPYDNYHYTL